MALDFYPVKPGRQQCAECGRTAASLQYGVAGVAICSNDCLLDGYVRLTRERDAEPPVWTFVVAPLLPVPFPVDMLRHGRAYPTEQDECLRLMDCALLGVAEVTLVSTSHRPPDDARWRSFNWHVVSVRKDGEPWAATDKRSAEECGRMKDFPIRLVNSAYDYAREHGQAALVDESGERVAIISIPRDVRPACPNCAAVTRQRDALAAWAEEVREHVLEAEIDIMVARLLGPRAATPEGSDGHGD